MFSTMVPFWTLTNWMALILLHDRRGTTLKQTLRMSNRDVLVRLLQNQASRAEQESATTSGR